MHSWPSSHEMPTPLHVPLAQTSPAPAPSDTHKSYDQKARECRKLAKGQGLSGEALRAFIADCVKH